jgi:plastocyanin
MSRPLRFLLCLLIGFIGATAALLCRTPPALAGTESVTMAHYAFSPASLTVRVGDTVTWTNTDQAPHDVTTTSAPVPIHSPTLKTGMTWSYTFTTPGTYAYICSIHPDMHATLVVQPAAPPTKPADQAPAAPANTSPRQISSPPASVMHMPTARPVSQAMREPMVASAPRSAPPMTTTGSTPVIPATAAAASGTQSSLNPLLLLAGLVAAIATFCLLLLGSRPEPAGAPPNSPPPR